MQLQYLQLCAVLDSAEILDSPAVKRRQIGKLGKILVRQWALAVGQTQRRADRCLQIRIGDGDWLHVPTSQLLKKLKRVLPARKLNNDRWQVMPYSLERTRPSTDDLMDLTTPLRDLLTCLHGPRQSRWSSRSAYIAIPPEGSAARYVALSASTPMTCRRCCSAESVFAFGRFQ